MDCRVDEDGYILLLSLASDLKSVLWSSRKELLVPYQEVGEALRNENKNHAFFSSCAGNMGLFLALI